MSLITTSFQTLYILFIILCFILILTHLTYLRRGQVVILAEILQHRPNSNQELFLEQIHLIDQRWPQLAEDDRRIILDHLLQGLYEETPSQNRQSGVNPSPVL